jgi:hypothetical protein
VYAFKFIPSTSLHAGVRSRTSVVDDIEAAMRIGRILHVVIALSRNALARKWEENVNSRRQYLLFV